MMKNIRKLLGSDFKSEYCHGNRIEIIDKIDCLLFYAHKICRINRLAVTEFVDNWNLFAV